MTLTDINPQIVDYVILPLGIFLARVMDVTIGTLRIIFVSRGKKRIAPILGFFEVLIWIIAISRIMQNLDNFMCYIGYAGGFATGNYVGMLVEEKLAMGTIVVRIITRRDASQLIQRLNSGGYGATSFEAIGGREEVSIVYSIINRKNLNDVITIIQNYNPKAFYTVEDVRYANQGIFPLKSPVGRKPMFHLLRWRRGK